MNGDGGEHERRDLSVAAQDSGESGSFLSQVIEATRGLAWRVGTAPEEAPVWIYVESERAPAADKGWKLHVSAALPHAPEVLERSLGVLLAGDTSFKVAASMAVLGSLNEGEAGLGQIGKFITVYPERDDEAVRLALALHEATSGLRGPPILSDRPLVTGSLVHYRYGAFSEPVSGEQNSGGERDELAARPTYVPPADVSDPFLRAGVSVPDDKGSGKKGFIDGRYFVTSTLHRSARGAVHIGVDMQEVGERILKRAWRDARLTPDGVDARDQLREEAEKLQRIEGKGPWPRALDLVDDATDLVLVLERVPGISLAAAVHRLFDEKRPPSVQRIADWAETLAGALATLHREGLVYRDLNPENVIVGPGGSLSLVDFELAMEPGPVSEFYVAGTPGFISPNQAAGKAASFSDDVYAFGALLVFMSIGARPPEGAEGVQLMEARLDSEGGAPAGVLVEIARECLEESSDSGADAGSGVMETVRDRLSKAGRG